MKFDAGQVTEICYVTHDLERAVTRASEIVGAGPFFLMDFKIPQKIYRGAPGRDEFKAVLGFSGTTLVEYIQPTNDEPSVFREVLDSKGDLAVHHIFPNLRPLKGAAFDALCAEYEAQGLEQVVSFEVPGIGRNVFYDARRELGVFLEILESGDELFHLINTMYAAHLQGAQGRPLRHMNELFAAPH